MLYNLAVKQHVPQLYKWSDLQEFRLQGSNWRVLFQLGVTLYALQCAKVQLLDLSFEDIRYHYAPSTQNQFLNYMIDDTVYHMFIDFQVIFPILNRVQVKKNENYPLNIMWLELLQEMVRRHVISLPDIVPLLSRDVVHQNDIEMNFFGNVQTYSALVDPLPTVIQRIAALAGHRVLVPLELYLTNQLIHFALRQQDFDAHGTLIQSNPVSFTNMRYFLAAQPETKTADEQQRVETIEQLQNRIEKQEDDLSYELTQYDNMLRAVNLMLLTKGVSP